MNDTKSFLSGCIVWIIALVICFKACGYIDGWINSLSTPDAIVELIPVDYRGGYKQISNAIENGDEEPCFLQISEKEISIKNPADDYLRTEVITKVGLYENRIKMYFHRETFNRKMEFNLILHEGVYVLEEELNGEILHKHGRFVKLR